MGKGYFRAAMMSVALPNSLLLCGTTCAASFAEKDSAVPFLVHLDNAPIGYIQYYRAAYGDPAWWPDTPAKDVFGIDQFIGNPDHLGQQIGRTMIAMFCERLFVTESACEIRVDPDPGNARAIRCYESVGFISRGLITTPDGPAQWMTLSPMDLNRQLLLPIEFD